MSSHVDDAEPDVENARDDAQQAWARTHDDAEARSTRAQFLVAAAAGTAGVALTNRGAWFLADDAAAAPWLPDALSATPPRGRERRFVSRPDLRPPAVDVLRRTAGVGDGLLFLTPSSGPGQRGALIVDNAGDVVWFRPSTPLTTMAFRPALYKGKRVLTWWEGSHRRGVGTRGEYVIADASYRVIERFRSRDDLWPDFHEYLLTADGTAFVVSYDPVPANLASVGGARRGRAYDCVIQEISIPSGRVLFEWRSLDHVRITESYETPRRNHPYDYFHVNSVGFDSDGHLLVCARNTWAIYKIHRRTGRVIWRLGGKRSDFAMGSGTRFAFQHDARSRANGRVISLFDNGPVPNADRESRALMLALDEKRMRATLARQIRHTPPLFARITGNAQVLGNGNVLVCWGNTGYFTEYGDDNRPRFDARLPRGGQNYRVYRSPWSGRPAARPRIAARAASGGTRLYASWNGATEVGSWQLRTGPSPERLEPRATVPRRGFETVLPVPDAARYAAAVALSRNGRPLRTSNIVRVR